MTTTTIVELSKDMLQYAQSEQWDRLEKTQVEQALLLRHFFDNLVSDVSEKEQQNLVLVKQLNTIITTLLEKNKADMKVQLLKLKQDQLKIKSYQVQS